jgi:hypothetical protein
MHGDVEVFLGSLKDVVFVPHERSLTDVRDRKLDALTIGGLMAKGGLTKIVSRVESSMVILGNVLEGIISVTQGCFSETEENIELLSGAVQNLISVLEPPVTMDEKFEAPTL